MANAEKKAFEKKWNETAERDLVVAMLCSQASGGSLQLKWPVIHANMLAMGYTFTESAIKYVLQIPFRPSPLQILFSKYSS